MRVEAVALVIPQAGQAGQVVVVMLEHHLLETALPAQQI
jgi:hypothetical protein